MAERIWKWNLPVTDTPFPVAMPIGSRILTVQDQQPNTPDVVTMWAICPEAQVKTRYFVVYGTGHHHEEIMGVYLGTVQKMHGQLVWHVFEVEAP